MKRRQAKKIVRMMSARRSLRWKAETVRRAWDRRYRFHRKNKATQAWFVP